MLLRGGEDEDGVVWRLLEGLEEGVEGGLAEHVDLVDDVDLVSPHLRRDAHLLDERAYVVDGVVRGRVELVDVERALLVEGATRFARVAGLALGGEVHAIDGLGEDACAGRLADAARAAEEVGVSQLIVLDRVLERCGQCGLPHDAVECSGAILARRYDVFIRLFHCGAKVGEWAGLPDWGVFLGRNLGVFQDLGVLLRRNRLEFPIWACCLEETWA